jgi:hypothetical protein
MNQEVTEYINNLKQPWQAEICNQLRQIIHKSIPNVEELIQYRKPHYKKNGKYAAVIGTAKEWVSFMIFSDKTLEAPEGLFEPGKQTIKIREGQDVDYDLFAKLLKQAANTQ